MAEKTSEEKVVKKPRTTKKVAEEVSADAPVKKAPVKKTTTTAKKATTTAKKSNNDNEKNNNNESKNYNCKGRKSCCRESRCSTL